MRTKEDVRDYNAAYYAAHREEQRARGKSYYESNKDARLAYQRKRRSNPEYQEDMKQYLRERYRKSKAALYALKRRCALCGYDTHPAVLDMHHNFPKEKQYKDNRFTARAIAAATELSRCVVLCANCHRLIEAELPEG